MGPHQRARIKKNFHWFEREIRENGINIKPNQNPVKWERRKIRKKINSSIVMNAGTMP